MIADWSVEWPKGGFAFVPFLSVCFTHCYITPGPRNWWCGFFLTKQNRHKWAFMPQFKTATGGMFHARTPPLCLFSLTLCPFPVSSPAGQGGFLLDYALRWPFLNFYFLFQRQPTPTLPNQESQMAWLWEAECTTGTFTCHGTPLV